MTGAVSLPMYDWPEIRKETDRLWQAIHRQLTERGIAAPASLDRRMDLEALWTDPDLILSQTCGYPYAHRLANTATLVATPAHELTGAAPGHYYSVLVARRNRQPKNLAELEHKRFAYNMAHSQSGFAAPVRLLAATGHVSSPPPLQTGSHRASIQAVARSEADWAAIDAVTWQLALRHEPAAGDLAVIARTPETPALPLITGSNHAGQSDIIADAVDAAIQGLDEEVRKAVLVTGSKRFKPADYAPFAVPVPIGKALPRMTG
ncbi:PhnD/SsuA/transferrin family substrate-binding protein [Hoeflea sp. YIM 152468]|uniref:phosphate/phosphite/phosphonate ABC transporter substrate-binding protein n=1 Tax=Hoeflea sp. YIM 152468 TaxID=3031759 RepID=UPI0023DAB6C7|nr:PhnD/SsuA/transferrin family substrate-binding protein [Hoeflea sp. YIM 152468]MDF1607920.1 PhnD/SsuA/transferrin family substrate-binding protein [Hoeflea sp. YIM 152468]